MQRLELTERETEFFTKLVDLFSEHDAMLWSDDNIRISLHCKRTFDLYLSCSPKKILANIRKVDPAIISISRTKE